MSIFFDFTFQLVAIGTFILGIVAGMLGCFAVLRKQSLLGDAISHAALPGICVAFMLTLSKHPLVLVLGASIAGWLGTAIMSLITQYTRLKRDAALGIVLSVFFGFGLVLLTMIQKTPVGSQSGLNTFLFGSAATLLPSDIRMMLFLGIIALIVLFLFWKEFKLLTFDPDYAEVLGYPTVRLDVLLTSLIVLAIVIGLQTVGVVLMSALVIAPSVSARQWTNRFPIMLGLAALFGGVSGTVGALLSSHIRHLPTGPTIVLIISLIGVISLLFAPNRGVFWDWWRRKRGANESAS